MAESSHRRTVILTAVLLIAVPVGVTVFSGTAVAGHCDGPGGMCGNGTADSPYQITNEAKLQAVEQDLDAHYVIGDGDHFYLGDGIKAGPTSGWNGGAGFDPIGSESDPFTGTFNGQNHTVWNLHIDRGTTESVGLFGAVGPNGTVKNVELRDADITGNGDVGGLIGLNEGTVTNAYVTGTVSGTFTMGGLVGENSGTVTESYATGTVSGSGDFVGGLVGNNPGTVTGSYATSTVSGSSTVGGLVANNGGLGTVRESSAAGNVSASGDYVGGLVGRNAGNLTESSARGDVSGNRRVGGLVGSNSENVTESYATGNVSGSLQVGGLVGDDNFGRSTTLDSYWDTESTGQLDSEGGTGLTTAQMTGDDAPNNMDGFDFTNTWEETNDYPHLGFEPAFDVSIAGRSAPTLAGETLTVTVAVANNGGVADRQRVWLSAGGQRQDTTYVSLDPGESTTVTLDWAVSEDDAGPQDVTVASPLVTANQTVPIGGFPAGVDGTSDDPYVITNAAELQAMELDHGGYYVLGNDIDASATSGWDDGNGFDPVGGVYGSEEPEFTGTFDGRNHTISNLHIDRGSANNVGLFGESEGTVENVHLEAVDITGNDHVGALVGVGGSGSTVRESSATGTVSGSNRVGGLVGVNVITNTVTESNAAVTVSGAERVGGLVGYNYGTVNESSSAGAVSGDRHVGGFAGYNDAGGIVRASSATGTVSGSESVGGLAGVNYGTVNESSATGDVSSSGNNAGGLVGDNFEIVTESSATGDVSGSNRVGGLVGRNVEFDGTVRGSNATGDVTGDDYVGGLVGFNEDDRIVNESFATGDVSGSSFVGGLVGANQGDVRDSYATGTVSGDIFVGGLVGDNERVIQDGTTIEGTITGSHAIGDVSSSDDPVGGLVGVNSGTLTESYAAGNVSGDNGDADPGSILSVGGLVGFNSGPLRQSYATGDVSSEEEVGGLVGSSTVTVPDGLKESYATGRVNGSTDVGGLLGVSGTATDSYWDKNSTEQSDSAAGIGLTTAQMTGADATTNMDGFDFANTWEETNHYPHLGFEPAFDVSIEETNAPVYGGETLTVTATVTNTGDVAGRQDVWLTAAGQRQDVERVALAPGESATVTLNWTVSDGDAGNQAVRVSSPDATVTESVTIGALNMAGDGTRSNPYVITNAVELQAMRLDLDAHYVLGNDIDASATSGWNAGDGFYQVGDDATDVSTTFTGSFDGRNHTISNLHIDRGSTDDVGMFGALGQEGRVENVHLEAVDVTGDDYVGGLVGGGAGTVRRSSVTGTVSGDRRVGGLVGQNFYGTIVGSHATAAVSGSVFVGGLTGDNRNTVRESYSIGNVSGAYQVGGLAGLNAGTVEESYAKGTVSASKKNGDGLVSSKNAGGLVGVNAGTITDSHARGTVSGAEQVGGLVGRISSGTVSTSYATGAVNGSIAVGGLVGVNEATVTDSYWDVNTTGQNTSAGGDGATGLTTDEMTAADATANMDGFNLTGTDTWRVTFGYPHLRFQPYFDVVIEGTNEPVQAGETLTVTARVYTTEDVLDRQRVWLTATDNPGSERQDETRITLGPDESTTVTLDWTVDDDADGPQEVSVATPRGLAIQSVDIVGFRMAGNGTSADPYVIPNATQLEAVSQDLDAHYVLGNDIDASATSGWDNGKGFDPIGGSSRVGEQQFTGTFDGRNHTISNLYIDRGTEYVGLFGVVGSGAFGEPGGTVRNVDLEDVDITGDDHTGGLAGETQGTVTGASVTGTVSGANRVGGLAGVNKGDVSESYATADVSGSFFTGGLVGGNFGGTVTQSYATGDVSGSTQVGGLAGSNIGTIEESYATGKVSGSNFVGGLVGRNEGISTEGTVTDSYWDTETTGQEGSAGGDGATGLTTANMTGADATAKMDGFDFGGYWTVQTGSTPSYPFLLNNPQVPPPLSDSTPGVANISITAVETTAPVTEGETLTITVDLENVGGASGTQDVTMRDFDGATVDSQELSLNAGEQTELTLDWATNEGDAGSGDVTVATENGSATESVTVERVDTNEPPTASDDSYTVSEGETLTVTAPGILDNDTDPNGDSLSVSTSAETAPENGSLTLNADGSFEYTPADGFTGTDSFTYSITDGNSTDTATVTVTVQEVPTATPALSDLSIAGDGTVATITDGENESISVTVENVGETSGTFTVTLDIGNGAVTDSATTAELDSNETNSVTFERVTGSLAPGKYDVTVTAGDAERTGSLNVSEGSEPPEPDTVEFETSITEVNESVVAGENVTVAYTIENVGNETGTQDIAFSVNDTVETMIPNISLNGSESTSGTVTYETDATDSPSISVTIASDDDTDTSNVEVGTKAFYEVDVTGTNAPIVEGDTLTVNGTVTNTGGKDGKTQEVNLSDFDGVERDSETFSLNAGEQESFSLSLNTAVGDSATDDVTVASADDTESRKVWVQRKVSFAVNITDTNSPVTEGDTLTVDVNVTNTGDETGTQTLNLTDTYFNNAEQDTVDVTLAGGKSNDSITLDWDTSEGDNGTVNVTVFSENDTDTGKVTIKQSDANTPPVANFIFTPENPSTADTVEFNASLSEDSDGSITDYAWDFGDGSSATGRTVTHSYGDNGTFTVNLTVTDDDGDTSNTAQVVVVEEEGVDRGTGEDGCMNRREVSRGESDEACPNDEGTGRRDRGRGEDSRDVNERRDRSRGGSRGADRGRGGGR